MARFTLGLILLAGAAFAGSCGELDECANLPASFQLEVQLADSALGPDIVFLALTLRADDARWRRRFPIDAELDDGRTSIAINISPAPTTPFDLVVDAAALDIRTSTLASGRIETVAEPSGCNRFEVDLE